MTADGEFVAAARKGDGSRVARGHTRWTALNISRSAQPRAREARRGTPQSSPPSPRPASQFLIHPANQLRPGVSRNRKTETGSPPACCASPGRLTQSGCYGELDALSRAASSCALPLATLLSIYLSCAACFSCFLPSPASRCSSSQSHPRGISLFLCIASPSLPLYISSF